MRTWVFLYDMSEITQRGQYTWRHVHTHRLQLIHATYLHVCNMSPLVYDVLQTWNNVCLTMNTQVMHKVPPSFPFLFPPTLTICEPQTVCCLYIEISKRKGVTKNLLGTTKTTMSEKETGVLWLSPTSPEKELTYHVKCVYKAVLKPTYLPTHLCSCGVDHVKDWTSKERWGREWESVPWLLVHLPVM